MLLASIPDVLRLPQAVSIFGHLGYPVYLLPFLGTAKTLGIIAVLVPAFQRLKEWAYAGLVFDVIGALYSHVSVCDPPQRLDAGTHRLGPGRWLVSLLPAPTDLTGWAWPHAQCVAW